MDTIKDLNSLSPQPRTVHLGDNDYSVNPPDVNDFMRIGVIGEEMRDNADGLTAKQQSELLAELRTIINRCSPAMADATLNMPQLMAMIEILADMAKPEDTKQLAAAGIETASPKDRGLSQSSKS